MTYEQWIKEVDTLLNKRYGMSSDSLPDYDWYGEFDGENEPDESVEEYTIQMEDYVL